MCDNGGEQGLLGTRWLDRWRPLAANLWRDATVPQTLPKTREVSPDSTAYSAAEFQNEQHR